MDSGLSMAAPFLHSRLHGSHEPRAAAEEVHRGVMHEVPNEDANPTVPALINLGRLDNLLLQGRWNPPVHHVSRVLVLIGPGHEAGVVGSQTGGEHPGAPGPPGLHEVALALRHLHDVQAGVVGLLLSRVGDLRYRWHLPVARLADAAVVAIAHRVDRAVRPDLATQTGLLGDLQVLVEVNPATSTWALVRESLGRHEIVGGLHTNADIDLISSIGQLDLLPKLWVLWIILAVVELLDTTG
mmetsp:Transcript_18146/g.39964  ORF Transcript_18146/g.39964 Transcript_18146/m.39964 type:complete len:241 (-) Transcript_18146:729-1451(-)